MDALVHEGWQFFKLIIDNWAALLIVSGIFGWMYRKITKKQEEQLRILLVVIKRVELGEAIHHDYGLQIVSGIFDEYTALGAIIMLTKFTKSIKRRKKMIFNNKFYNVIKWAVLTALPALSVFIGVIGKAYGWGGTDLAIITLNAFTVFLGTLAGVSAVKYNNQSNETKENK